MGHPCTGRVAAARAGRNTLEKRQPPSDPRPRPPLRRLLDWVDCPVPNTKTMYAQYLRARVCARKICIAYTGQ